MDERELKLSRRDFIKTAGAGVAGATLLSGSLGSMTGTALAAAGPPNLAVEKGAALKVLRWSPFVAADKDIWEQNTRKWEQATGGKVVTEYLSWEDVRPKAAMEASVGAGHDIVLGWHDDPFLYPDKLLDVTDVCAYLGGKYGGWEDVAVKYGVNPKTGRWIDIPIGGPGQAICYRKSWVNEAGYPEMPLQMDKFIDCCKKLKAKGHPVGFALGHAVGDGNNWAHGFLWAFGGKTVNKDGSPAINSKETRAALAAMKDLYDNAMIPGCASWLDPHNNKAYLAGEISATNNGISIYYAAKKDFPQVAEDTFHQYPPRGPSGKPTELHLFDPAFIFKHTPYPQAAKHYLMFMMEKEQAGPWINGMLGYVSPALKAYKELPVWTSDPKHTVYRDCIANMLWTGYEGPIGPASAAVMAEYVVVDLFANVCAKGMSADKAIEVAERAIVKAYKVKKAATKG
jgi:multiple sugar transport system substrate-binding protein